MFKEIFLGKEKIFNPSVILFHSVLIVLSFIFIYLFSYSTSFLYPFLGGDSSVFQVVGKYWLEGFLPYKDIFDHKGLLLYFINSLGYAIYPRVGVMVPQIIFLYLSCLFIWRAMELYSSNTWQKIFFLLIGLIFYAAHYEEGNHVEEYNILFLSVAAYFFLRSLKENIFPPLYGFIYGFCFGACVLIRTSDAAQICCQVFLIAIFLLQERAFKNFGQNFLSFCAGFATIVLPFVIYFAAHGALYEMFYGTILFNLKYIGANFHQPLIFQILYYVVHFLPLFIMIIVAVLTLKQNPKSRLLQSGIFIGLIMSLMLMNLRPYLHYAIIIFPVIPILFAILHESRNEFKKTWQASGLSFKRILVKFLIVLVVVDVYVLILHLKETYFGEPDSMRFLFPFYDRRDAIKNPNEAEDILTLSKLIPEDEKISLAMWGEYCTTPHWVIYTDIKPRERLFMNNSRLAKIDPAFRKEWFDNIRKDYPLWILYGTAPNRKSGEPIKTQAEDAELEQLLKEKYLFKGEVYVWPQMMKLYRLKE